MSTASTPSSAAGTAPASAAGHASAHGSRKTHGGAGQGADQFSNLMLLLSADDAPGIITLPGQTDALAADDPLASDATEPGASNLTALLEWAALPIATGTAASDASTASATQGGTSAPDPALTAALAGAATDDGPFTGNTASALATDLPTTPGATQGAAPTTPSVPATAAPSPLAGMQYLSQPDALDAPPPTGLPATAGSETTPSARAAADGPATAPQALAPGTTAGTQARPTAWRSTVQAPSTQALQQAHHQQNTQERLQVRVDTEPVWRTRSTVTLDERFSPADSPAPAANGSGLAPLGTALATPSGGPQGDATGHPGDHPDARDASHDGPEQRPGDDNWLSAEADAAADERLDSFASPHLRQASLRIGEEGDDSAVDIHLSLSGQELDVKFRTDNPEARAEIARDAQGTLSDMLQRSGIQLGDVSVSAQNGQGGGQHGQSPSSATPRPSASPVGRSEGPQAGDAGGTPAPQRPRTDGNRPLDLFV